MICFIRLSSYYNVCNCNNWVKCPTFGKALQTWLGRVAYFLYVCPEPYFTV